MIRGPFPLSMDTIAPASPVVTAPDVSDVDLDVDLATLFHRDGLETRRRLVRPDHSREGTFPPLLQGDRKAGSLASRGRDVTGSLDGGALRSLPCIRPDVRPCGGAAGRPSPSDRRALVGGTDVRQGCCGRRRRHPGERSGPGGTGPGVHGPAIAGGGPDGGGVPRSRAETDHESRSVRFNDTCHTVTAQLPPESYAQVKSRLETGARALPSDGETRWDQRVADVYMQILQADGTAGPQNPSPYTVVVHAPLETLADESSELAGELERDGLISAETVRRLACDATVMVALDDEFGHTMYEGRARRFPSGTQRREVVRRDRHCRFPGCANVTFTNVHHIKPWGSGGRTDLENLVLMCQHHHYRLHSSGWSMTGNANEELTLVAPTGRRHDVAPVAALDQNVLRPGDAAGERIRRFDRATWLVAGCAPTDHG